MALIDNLQLGINGSWLPYRGGHFQLELAGARLDPSCVVRGRSAETRELGLRFARSRRCPRDARVVVCGVRVDLAQQGQQLGGVVVAEAEHSSSAQLLTQTGGG